MVNAYGVLKFLHVLSVIVWIGGVASLSVVTWRLRRERNRELLVVLLRQATSFGQLIAGPASLIVLLSGLAMVGMAHLGFSTFWVLYGFGGIIVHGLIGVTLIRTRAARLSRRVSSTNARYDSALESESARLADGNALWQAQILYLVVMASVVGAMVLKPTL